MARTSHSRWIRAAALITGLAVPALGTAVPAVAGRSGTALPVVGTVHTLPTLPPHPTLPPTGGITILVVPPSLSMVTFSPPPDGCVIARNYTNPRTPLESIFQGWMQCGSQVYQPSMTGQAVLDNALSQTVAVGNSFGPVVGNGPFTSEGVKSLPTPALTYGIVFSSSITLPLQTWGPPAPGCSVSGSGYTLTCQTTAYFDYFPGTQGGEKPA